MNDSSTEADKQSFLSVAISNEVVVRSINVALVVGTILACINHGEKIMSMSFSNQDLFKIILTYLVPYGVSTWSAVMSIRTTTSD